MHLPLTSRTARYLLAVSLAIESGRDPATIGASDLCRSCGKLVTEFTDGAHVFMELPRAGDHAPIRYAIVLDCENYLCVDPNQVGINAPTWP